MSVSVNISDELYQQAQAVAESQHSPVEQVISSAFVEQMSAWERLKKRAARGSREASSKY